MVGDQPPVERASKNVKWEHYSTGEGVNVVTAQARKATILHISDLHFSVRTEFDRTVVLESLLAKIREESQWLPDLICCTGDIAFSGQDEEYEQAKTFFAQLLDATYLEKLQLFSVPGNHDVDLSRLGDSHREASKRFAVSDYSQFLAKSNEFFDNPELLKTFLVKFTGYRHFSEAFLGRSFDEDDKYYFAEITPARSGLQIGIVGLNSAWLFENRGKLIEYGCQLLGVRSLQKAFRKLESQGRPDLTVVMFHHPIEWLFEHERSQVRELLRGKADLVLQGHQDNPDQQYYDVGIGPRRTLVLQEGPAYEGSHYPNRVEFARCEVSDKTKTVEVYSTVFDSKTGLWVLDTTTFAKQKRRDSHGYFVLSETEPPMRPLRPHHGIRVLLPTQVDFEASVINVKRELEHSIADEGEVDHKFAYLYDEGAEGWCTLCEFDEYDLFKISRDFLVKEGRNIYSKIVEASKGRRVFDLFDIGVGNGEKDAIMLEILLRESKASRIKFYAFDVSMPLIKRATDLLKRRLRGLIDRVEIIRLCGDMRFLPEYKAKAQISIGDNPLLIMFSGGTLGNFKESVTLSAIHDFMDSEKDYFLLGVEYIAGRSDEELLEEYEIEKLKDFVFGPLGYSGIADSELELIKSLKPSVVPWLRIVPKSKPIAYQYPIGGRNVILFRSTKYGKNSLISYLKDIKFHVVESDFCTSDGRYGEILLKRSS